jgi:adenosylmethionine-8-amino-7-oxononanoate aminotransferase
VAGDHLLLAPPFIIKASQVDDLVGMLEQAITAAEKALPVGLRG